MSRAVELVELALDLVGRRGEAEARATVGNLALTRFANSFIHQNVAEDSETLWVRVTVEGATASAATTNLDREALEAFVDDLVAAARLRPADPDWPGLAPPAVPPAVDHHDEATERAEPRERAERVRGFVDAGGGETLAAGYCETTGGEVAFANTAGQHLRGRSSQAVLDGIHTLDGAAGSGHGCAASLAGIDVAAVASLAVDRARLGRNPRSLEPGEYEVVLAPECVATIAVFLAYYGFNAKLALEGQSFAELGVTQFDEAFSMWDDVTDDRALGVPFDAEGTPKRRVDFVRDGTTVGLAHDRRTAAKMGVESTGHHVPGSETMGPFPTNVFVGEGDRSPEALVAEVERGLYVATFNYCRVLDPKTVSVTGLTRNGTFLVEDGRIVGAVENLRFTQSFLEALAPGRILGVGDDGRFADSEFGPGMMHVPSLRLARWRFTGGASG
ncbi:MAG TPA: TldD/PmbA family protein [Actinobacteria bacterium]|nr:TldD/PmbA family protein [Actinomycetota bacterium]